MELWESLNELESLGRPSPPTWGNGSFLRFSLLRIKRRSSPSRLTSMAVGGSGFVLLTEVTSRHVLGAGWRLSNFLITLRWVWSFQCQASWGNERFPQDQHWSHTALSTQGLLTGLKIQAVRIWWLGGLPPQLLPLLQLQSRRTLSYSEMLW